MITLNTLGVRGRLGNQLFQIAFMLGLAKKHNLDMKLPKWKYAQYFQYPVTSEFATIPFRKKLEEDHFHYVPHFWAQYAKEFRDHPYDITCWGQTEKYFDHCKQDVATAFSFHDDIKERVAEKMPQLMAIGKKKIAISIRQGDYVGNPNYELLPIQYYLMALLEYFPDFRDQEIYIFSDDMAYCKMHFQCLDNVYYAEGLNDIEQLCAGSICDHAILANSTFSWWMGWLIEYGLEGITTIVRPNYLFKGQLMQTSDSRDFYPERWKIAEHKAKKIDLTNTTFTIPVSYDSRDRQENIDLSIKYLRDSFYANIMVCEHGRTRFEYLKDITNYRHFGETQEFHRTKMLNDMAADCKTPVIVNWDADVIIPPLQIIEAVYAITNKGKDMVYPYDGRFARVPRTMYKELDRRVDVGCLSKLVFPGMKDGDAKSVGGAIFWKDEAFLKGGMENEKMISYGPEDAERYDRFTMLGYKIHRIKGPLYHIDHVQSMNSSVKHPHFNDNVKEHNKIRRMSKEELEAYVETWPWAARYTPTYYETIFKESVKSRDAVFKVLEDEGFLRDKATIVDCGCALGAWGHQSKYSYRGIDFGIPEEKLAIPIDHYIDHDLNKPLSISIPQPKFDLVLSLEVCEHLKEGSAETVIDTLTSLGDVILFSAAIPGQGGINHFNEQWQSWWAKKFADRGYFPYPYDLRKSIWNNEDVGLWYRQNIILYCKEIAPRSIHYDYELDVIHPKMYMNLMRHHRILK